MGQNNIPNIAGNTFIGPIDVTNNSNDVLTSTNVDSNATMISHRNYSDNGFVGQNNHFDNQNSAVIINDFNYNNWTKNHLISVKTELQNALNIVNQLLNNRQ